MTKLSYLDRLAEYGISGAHPGGLALTQGLLRNENITANTALLDVGCGTGQTAAYIAGHYPCKVTAADINPMMLEKARQNFAGYKLDIALVRANVMDLPFHKHSFDIILAESVTVFTNPRKTLREYYRVLKPGGILLEVEATALSPLTRDETGDFRRVLGIEWMPTADEWCQMFQEAGFSMVRVLLKRRMNWTQALSPRLKQNFGEYAGILLRYKSKFGYGVYRIIKGEE